MDLALKGKVAVVTGVASNRGIGWAISKTLAEEGADGGPSARLFNWEVPIKVGNMGKILFVKNFPLPGLSLTSPRK